MQIFKAVFATLAFTGSFITALYVKDVKPALQPPAKVSLITSYGNMDAAKQKKQVKDLLKPRQKPAKVAAFYVWWDKSSFVSLKQNIGKIDILMPEWLHLKDDQGNLTVDDLNYPGPLEELIREHKGKVTVMPLLNNFSGKTLDWDSEVLKKVLHNPWSRKNLIKNLVVLIKSHNFQGINVDFELIPGETQQRLLQFMKELSQEFRKEGLQVSQDVPLDDDQFDYKAYSAYNDYLILMAYDQHWNTSGPGPVSSQYWFREKLKKRMKQVPADKIIVGLGNYGYDWVTKTKKGNSLTNKQVNELREKFKAKVQFDKTLLNPAFGYYDENKVLHHVWYLDNITAYNQIVEALGYNSAGLALWRLGSEDPALWNFFDF